MRKILFIILFALALSFAGVILIEKGTLNIFSVFDTRAVSQGFSLSVVIVEPPTTLLPNTVNQKTISGTISEDLFNLQTGSEVSSVCYTQINQSLLGSCLQVDGLLLDAYFQINFTLPNYQTLHRVFLTSTSSLSGLVGNDNLSITLFNFSSGDWVIVNQSGNPASDTNITLTFNITSSLMNNFVSGNRVMFMSRTKGTGVYTLGQDYLEALVNFLAPVSVGSTINHPQNVTYHFGSAIPINILVSAPANISNSFFNIDNGENVTLKLSNSGSNISTFSTPDGSHTFYLFINNTNGNISSSSVIFSVNNSQMSQFSFSNFNGSTTNLSAYNATQLQNLTNFTVTIPGLGGIFFLEPVNLTNHTITFGAIDLNAYINITSNKIILDSTVLLGLNKKALLSIAGPTVSNPVIAKDGIKCPSSVCTMVAYLKNYYANFTVTGFTEHSVAEDGSVPSSSEAASESATSKQGHKVKKLPSKKEITKEQEEPKEPELLEPKIEEPRFKPPEKVKPFDQAIKRRGLYYSIILMFISSVITLLMKIFFGRRKKH